MINANSTLKLIRQVGLGLRKETLELEAKKVSWGRANESLDKTMIISLHLSPMMINAGLPLIKHFVMQMKHIYYEKQIISKTFKPTMEIHSVIFQF